MRLALTTPPQWPLRMHGEQHVAIVDNEVVIAWGALVPRRDDGAAWVARALSVDGHSATLRLGDNLSRATMTGWPVRLVSATVASTDGFLEHRLGAFYSFLEYGAVVLVRARSQTALDAIRPQLDAVLITGAPAWHTGTPACLYDILAG